MQETPKIALLRWEAGKVSDALLQLETLPGNSTNPASYPFEMKLVHVKGANQKTVEENPCQIWTLQERKAWVKCYEKRWLAK